MNGAPKTQLGDITSHWSQISDPIQFVYRYSPAIRAYLLAFTRRENDVDDIIQDFLIQFLETRFHEKFKRRSRFRDYLKVCVRNAAVNHLRKRSSREKSLTDAELSTLAAPADDSLADQQWNELWRQCVIDKSWQALDQHQRQHDGNLFFSVLKARSENPKANSDQLAAMVQSDSNQTVSPESFRKQLSRARRMFARSIFEEVQSTLATGDRDETLEELNCLGLAPFVGPFVKDFLKNS